MSAAIYFRAGVVGTALFLMISGAYLAALAPPELHVLGTVLLWLAVAVFAYRIITYGR